MEEVSSRWRPERQVPAHACEACKANPDRQVLEGHVECLPPVAGMTTADGVPVAEGLMVWDYDLKHGMVTTVARWYDGTPDGPLGIVAWHEVTRDDGSQAMMDGSRLATVHPFTRRAA